MFLEALRKVTGTLPSAPPAKRTAKVLNIASGKGGTGKSVVASNLAVLRAQAGERVCLIDFDAGMANAHLLLGLVPKYDLGHVLDGQVSAGFALVDGPAGIKLLSGGVGRAALQNPTPRELDRLFASLAQLEAAFDLIIVDHGAGMGVATVAHIAAAQSLLLVTTHEVTALSDAYALYKHALSVAPDLRTGVVMNRAPDEATARGAWERFEGVARRHVGRVPEYVGRIPLDEAVLRSVQARVPVALREPHSTAGESLRTVARWDAIDLPTKASRAFYESARRALR